MDNDGTTMDSEELVDMLNDYARDQVEAVLKRMLTALFVRTPEDPLDFMIDFLVNEKEERDAALASQGEDGYSAEDVPRELQKLPIIHRGSVAGSSRGIPRGRRAGVSAESLAADSMDNVVLRFVPKSDQERHLLHDILKENIMFAHMERDEMKVMLDAMKKVTFDAGDVIIKQGDVGEDFYVLDQGIADCYVEFKDGTEPKLVRTYTHAESFGELALMYNAPRAATIKARSKCTVWSVDRLTFRHTLMSTTSSKRKKYEAFLGSVELLSSLKPYERSKLADVLEEMHFRDGDCILAQGDRGNMMFFLKEGSAVASKVFPGTSQAVELMKYSPGDYFGELALLNDAPRNASVFAIGDCVCVGIDRETMQRLLGPCEDIIKRNVQQYKDLEAKMAKAQLLGAEESTTAPEDNEKMKAYQGRSRGRRGSVFAAAEKIKEDWVPPHFDKTLQEMADIHGVVSKCFLFQGLHPDQMQVVIHAMFEKAYKKGDVIIKQGDLGDNFYVLRSGSADCFVRSREDDEKSLGKKVFEFTRGGSFGELALMYDAPRNASIVATDQVKVWALDRSTFRRVVMSTAQEKRKLYNSFLSQVPVLEKLSDYERDLMADALQFTEYKNGDYIIKQGASGDRFFILEKGAARVTKSYDGQEEPIELQAKVPGDFFGELALMQDTPRGANVIADGDCTCVHLDRDTFTRLLGPIQDVLSRAQSTYAELDRKALELAASPPASDSKAPRQLSLLDQNAFE